MLIAQWNILNRASDGWEAKGAMLTDALVRRGVDAACLQEVPADGLDALATAFAERGLTLAAGRLRQGRTDLCAVCWRTGALEPVGGPSGVPGVDCAIQAFDGLAVCSYHGAWGAFRQRERLDEARLLDARLSRCAAKGAVLLCGDFNAMPDEPAIRLLSGLSEAPTFWTEAQDTAAMLGRGGPYPTVLPGTSAEAAVTARSRQMPSTSTLRLPPTACHGVTASARAPRAASLERFAAIRVLRSVGPTLSRAASSPCRSASARRSPSRSPRAAASRRWASILPASMVVDS